MRKKIVKGVVLGECEKPQFSCEDILDISVFYFPPLYMNIIKFLTQYYSCSFGEGANIFIPFSSKQEDFGNEDKDKFSTNIELSHEQQRSFNKILNQDVTLLFGDTGSGKSEVYMKLFEYMIESKKTSIFLMPEISLTPQMQKRLKVHFGSRAVMWHSRLTKKSKEKILEKIYSGEVDIVAGARSALFLPLKNIGLIVVDEEHDDSYKSSSRPRYNARDMAVYMGKILDSKVVLGSATPSLTSFNKFPHVRLKGTYFDSKKEFLFDECESQISDVVVSQIEESMEKGRQVIVFLPTRANFKYLSCFSCGAFIECPYCSVGMSLHLDKNALKCHYCGYMEAILKVCPTCGKDDLRSNRIGTAEVVNVLKDKFPLKSIGKFDRDEITTEKKLKEILKNFNDQKIDILVGTQMLSKGHDYQNVDLAVVLGIDTILNQADFKAREKAMSLLIQIAGRSGRVGEGRVLIQTKDRGFFERYLRDYELFLKEELPFRSDLYPPFKKIVRILITHKYKNVANEILSNVRDCFENSRDIEVVGAGEAPISKLSSKFRFHILLRSDSVKALLESVAQCREKNCEIDIDPVNFS